MKKLGPNLNLKFALDLCGLFSPISFKGHDFAKMELRVTSIILNGFIPTPNKSNLLLNSERIICGDGGAKALISFYNSGEQEREILQKRYFDHKRVSVVGDMDSLSEDEMAWFTEKKIPLENLSKDQDSTDFQKCLNQIVRTVSTDESPSARLNEASDNEASKESTKTEAPSKQEKIEIHGQHELVVVFSHKNDGFRFDHFFSQLYSIFNFIKKAHESNHNIQVLLVLEESVILALGPGGHTVHLPPESIINRKGGVGLFPFHEDAECETEGFKWNLTKDWKLSLTGLLSSSNEIEKDVVTIKTSNFIYMVAMLTK